MSAEATGGLAYAVKDAFVRGRLDLAARPDASAPGRQGIPEISASEVLESGGVIGFARFWVVA
jgi:hypothetical protein